ncbi:MAG: hypothetical protein GY860_08805 [Desulfobacteraceae bacterium]|nr:hypothetical protein [Desulfobacteraceae bacterium]
MHISNIQQINEVYSSPFEQKCSKNQGIQSTTNTQTTDIVNISQEAKELSQNVSAEKNSSVFSEEELPIEAYSIPGWLSHLFTDYARVDDEIGIRYPQSRAAQYDSLSGKARANLGGYQDKLLKHFQEELKEQGIRSGMDYYQSIILDKEKSEEVHQAVRQRLANDSMTSKFMKDFGIT